MHCPQSDQLSALMDGRLESPCREALEAHIQGCAVCQQKLEQLESQSCRRPTGKSGEEAPFLGESDPAFLERLRALDRPGLLSGPMDSREVKQSNQGDLSTRSAYAIAPWPDEPTDPESA